MGKKRQKKGWTKAEIDKVKEAHLMWKGCHRKRTLKTWQLAKALAVRQGENFSAYKCKYCAYYHITSGRGRDGRMFR